MAGQGLQFLPLSRIPREWDAKWFETFCRDVLAFADTRNAIEGSGITITGQPGEFATISASEDLQNLLLQPFILASPSGFLQHERVLAGESGVVSITDGGDNSTITVGLTPYGLPLSKLPQLPTFGVLGNHVPALSQTEFIGAAVDGDVLTVQSSLLGFTNAPTWTGNHTWVDNAEGRWGTGGDLRLFHDGTNSRIRNDTGSLFVNMAGTDTVQFKGGVGPFITAGDGTNNSAAGLFAGATTAVRLGGVAGFATLEGVDNTGFASYQTLRIGGAQVDFHIGGTVRMSLLAATFNLRLLLDNQELQLGVGTAGVGDLRLLHDGTNSIIRNDTGELLLRYAASQGLTIENSAGVDQVRFTDSLATFGSGTATDYTITLNQAAGRNREFRWQSAGSLRWVWRVDSTAEGGANAGSNMVLLARDDAGGALGNPLFITRSNGAMTLGFGASSHVSLAVDNQELRIGAGPDLRLFHNGTDSIIRNDTGNLLTLLGAATQNTLSTALSLFVPPVQAPLCMDQRVITTAVVMPANTSAVVSESLEIANGASVNIGAGAALEVT